MTADDYADCLDDHADEHLVEGFFDMRLSWSRRIDDDSPSPSPDDSPSPSETLYLSLMDCDYCMRKGFVSTAKETQ